jgi:hypothetical protein
MNMSITVYNFCEEFRSLPSEKLVVFRGGKKNITSHLSTHAPPQAFRRGPNTPSVQVNRPKAKTYNL